MVVSGGGIDMFSEESKVHISLVLKNGKKTKGKKFPSTKT